MKNATAQPLEAAPVIIEGPHDASALVGEHILLTVLFSGVPSPWVTWKRAGRELQSDQRIYITCAEGRASLQLDNITTDDSGKYDVIVANTLGTATHFASVAVEGPPEPPSCAPQVTNGGAHKASALVTWSSSPFDGGRQIIGYRVECAFVSSAASTWWTACSHCHSLHFVVEGLQPGGRYVFRVRATNVHGTGGPSIESDVFQAEDENEDAPLDLRPVHVETDVEAFAIRFETQEIIGKGRFGVVRRVVDAVTTQMFAAKFVRCRTRKDAEKAREEISVMGKLRHAKLLQLIAAFECDRDVVLVTELISGGELFERVVADDFTLTEKDCIVFMRQICEGVAYMHDKSVAHLDLKPENIMCRTRTSHEIKIIDFGLARHLDPALPVRVLFGTPEFIAPEIINYEPISIASDMWSVGVICYVLLSGLSPFMGDNDAETFANITRADYDFEDDAFAAVSQNAREFIHVLLKKRKEDRMSAVNALRHRWLDPEANQDLNVVISTDKLKKFIIRRKWQKTGNAIRALGRMAGLADASRRNSSSTSNAQSLDEDDDEKGIKKVVRTRNCSERSDSGISDCSALQGTNSCTNTPLMAKKLMSNDVEHTWIEQFETHSQDRKSTSVRNKTEESVAKKVEKFDQLHRFAANNQRSETSCGPPTTAVILLIPNQLKQAETINNNNNSDLDVAPESAKHMKSNNEKLAIKNENFQKVSAFWNKFA